MKNHDFQIRKHQEKQKYPGVKQNPLNRQLSNKPSQPKPEDQAERPGPVAVDQWMEDI